MEKLKKKMKTKKKLIKTEKTEKWKGKKIKLKKNK